MNYSKEDIALILKALRAQSGYTQREVAALIGRTPQIIGHWETGYSQPDINSFIELCTVYGADMSTVFGIISTKTEKPAPTNEDELSAIDKELIRLLRQLSPEQIQRVRDFVQGLLAGR